MFIFIYTEKNTIKYKLKLKKESCPRKLYQTHELCGVTRSALSKKNYKRIEFQISDCIAIKLLKLDVFCM